MESNGIQWNPMWYNAMQAQYHSNAIYQTKVKVLQGCIWEYRLHQGAKYDTLLFNIILHTTARNDFSSYWLPKLSKKLYIALCFCG